MGPTAPSGCGAMVTVAPASPCDGSGLYNDRPTSVTVVAIWQRSGSGATRAALAMRR
jgi:hypothetical protein